MFIKRVEVEEGFLHGLNLELGTGLTVIFGARGSGKSSLLELIRFCQDVSPYTEGQEEVSLQHALAVLKSGRVTTTIDIDGAEVTFTRSSDETTPRRSSTKSFQEPIVLSQNEIERVGRDPGARLKLIDGFARSLAENDRSEQAARSLINSLTVELKGLVEEAESAKEQLAALSEVPKELEEARKEALKASADLKETADLRDQLALLGKEAAAGRVRSDVYERALKAVRERIRILAPALKEIKLESWPKAADSDDHLAAVRRSIDTALKSVQTASSVLGEAAEKLEVLHANEQTELVKLEDNARTLRTRIDELSEGAGALMKRVSDLEAKEGRMKALAELIAELEVRVAELRANREEELDQLDAIREERINAREMAATFLNSRLGPQIRVTVNRFGDTAGYTSALISALRGSGVQYNVLAPELTQKVSPRELVHAAETLDAELLSNLAGIPVERAQRICSHLHDTGTASILTAALNDTVELSLLDGGEYKPIEGLSVGQRCTAVLPIVVSHTDHVILIDQPEDNLDNSFITDTLVQALQNRPSNSQIIFVTHNPNIPVLGEADQVGHVVSDGRHGRIDFAGDLDDPASVEAITEIMEGGIEAFEKRAAFYAQESLSRESS